MDLFSRFPKDLLPGTSTVKPIQLLSAKMTMWLTFMIILMAANCKVHSGSDSTFEMGEVRVRLFGFVWEGPTKMKRVRRSQNAKDVEQYHFVESGIYWVYPVPYLVCLLLYEP